MAKNYDQELRDLMGDDDVDDALARLREVKEEKVRRLQSEKCRFYTPNGKCEEFIKAVGSGDNFITLFSAANGVGKTQVGANVVANIVFPGFNDEWFNQPLFKNWPYPKRGRIASNSANLPQVLGAIEDWFPKGKYKAQKAGKTYKSKWQAGEWEFDVMSYDQESSQFEGPTLGFIWLDEPPTEEIYKACVSRLRMGGVMFITATMLKGSGWLYDKIVAGDVEVEGIDGEKIKRQVKYMTAGVEEACVEHGIRGHLLHTDIQRMIAEYDPDEREARVFGRSQHLVGRIFKNFDRTIHVIKPFQVSLRDYCVLEALDPHPRNPDAVLWLAVDKYGRKFVVDELYIKCLNGTEELAQHIKEKAEKYRVIYRMCDPSGWNENQHEKDPRGVAVKLADYDLDYEKAPKMREAADSRIKDALAYTKNGSGEFIKNPELYIFETCRRTIWEIENYRWDEWAGKSADKHNSKEKPVDKDDHEVECLGRCLVIEPIFQPLVRYLNPNTGGGIDHLDPYA